MRATGGVKKPHSSRLGASTLHKTGKYQKLNFRSLAASLLLDDAILAQSNHNPTSFGLRKSDMKVKMDSGDSKTPGELEDVTVRQDIQGPNSGQNGRECHALHLLDEMPKSKGLCSVGRTVAALTSIRDKSGGLAHQPLEHATGVNSEEEDEDFAVQLCVRECSKLMLAIHKRGFSSKKYKMAFNATLNETLFDTSEGTQALIEDGEVMELFRHLREPGNAYTKVYSNNLGFRAVDVVETILKSQSCWEEFCLMSDGIIHDSSGVMQLVMISDEELQSTLVNVVNFCCLHKHDQLSNEMLQYDALQLLYKRLQLEGLFIDRREGDAKFGWLLESVIIPTGDKNSMDYFLEALQSIPYSYQDWRASLYWFLAAMIQCSINPIVLADNILLDDMDERVSLYFVNKIETKAKIVGKMFDGIWTWKSQITSGTSVGVICVQEFNVDFFERYVVLDENCLRDAISVLAHVLSEGREGTKSKMVCAGSATSRMRKENDARSDF
ncbi:hypothetical protein ACLB2K_046332 [Fragaria x ananassa]